MTKMVNKSKQFIKTLDAYRYYLMTSALLAMSTGSAFAGSGGGAPAGGASTATNPTSVMINLMKSIIGLFPAIGIVLIVVGGFKLFMAFRNDQPDAYSGAAKDIVIGIVCVIFETFVWPSLTNAMK